MPATCGGLPPSVVSWCKPCGRACPRLILSCTNKLAYNPYSLSPKHTKRTSTDIAHVCYRPAATAVNPSRLERVRCMWSNRCFFNCVARSSSGNDILSFSFCSQCSILHRLHGLHPGSSRNKGHKAAVELHHCARGRSVRLSLLNVNGVWMRKRIPSQTGPWSAPLYLLLVLQHAPPRSKQHSTSIDCSPPWRTPGTPPR